MASQKLMVRAALCSVLAAAAGGTCALLEAQVVVPNALESVVGNFDNRIPWDDQDPVRYQQVYLGTEVGSGEIAVIRFRQDELFGASFESSTLTGVTVVLSSTAAAPDGLSLTFADNLGADAMVFFSGDLILDSRPSGASPRPFDIEVRGESPFVFDASTGMNLLLDVLVTDGPVLTSFDAAVVEGDSVSRVFCWRDASCLAAEEAMIADSVGLVTLFLPNLIFGDGFESGDTSAWSATVP